MPGAMYNKAFVAILVAPFLLTTPAAAQSGMIHFNGIPLLEPISLKYLQTRLDGKCRVEPNNDGFCQGTMVWGRLRGRASVILKPDVTSYRLRYIVDYFSAVFGPMDYGSLKATLTKELGTPRIARPDSLTWGNYHRVGISHQEGRAKLSFFHGRHFADPPSR